MEDFVGSLPSSRAQQELSSAIRGRAHSAASKVEFTTTIWRNRGMITGIKPIGRLPYVGARNRD